VWDTESAVVETLSGPVEVRYTSSGILVSQDRGVVEDVSDPTLLDRIHALLSLGPGPLEGVTNASTSRVKTLIPTCIEQLQAIDAAKLDADQVRQLCDDLGSTGLYPFAVESRSPLRLHARQFPRSSGYTEDAATGIAAAAALYGALHLGLVSDQNGVTVRQGYAMGRPSAIAVELRTPGKPEDGCWISGEVELTTLEPLARDH
jgi:PhzF family phenazine biosynthesis protein